MNAPVPAPAVSPETLRRRRILFVDDEPNLLAGLRRMLRARRDVWDMEFAEGGEQALAVLAERPADLVVSDMRMPGMDGAQLLAEVRRRSPATSRMILSGHADRASIISAIGPTQQYLAKPCEVDVLVAALERVLAVREIVVDERLRRLLGDVESLPKPSSVFEDLVALAADPDCRIEDVVRVIESDLSSSAEVLRLVNSAFFGLPTRVDTVARAVNLLGLDLIQALAAAGAVFAAGGPPPAGLDPRRMLDRGLVTATVARRLAVAEGWTVEAVGDVFLAGLLHDIGLLVLAAGNPAAWDVLRAGEPGDVWAAAERQTEVFGCSATEASAYLLGLWGFPEGVVNAVADQPTSSVDASAAPASQLLTVARRWAADPGDRVDPMPGGWLTADRLDAWRAALPAPLPA